MGERGELIKDFRYERLDSPRIAHRVPPPSLQRNNAPPWPVTTVREPLRRTHPSLKQLLRHKGKPPPDDNFHDIFGVTHYVKTSVNHRTLHKLGPGGSLDCFSPLTFLISPWTDGSSDNTAGLFFFSLITQGPQDFPVNMTCRLLLCAFQ